MKCRGSGASQFLHSVLVMAHFPLTPAPLPQLREEGRIAGARARKSCAQLREAVQMLHPLPEFTSLLMSFPLVLLQHCAGGDFLGSFAVTPGPLRRSFDLFVLSLLFRADSSYMSFYCHISPFFGRY